jgi:hypothetical protein
MAAAMKDPAQLARAVNSLVVGWTNFTSALPLFDCIHALLLIGKVLQRQPLHCG